MVPIDHISTRKKNLIRPQKNKVARGRSLTDLAVVVFVAEEDFGGAIPTCNDVEGLFGPVAYTSERCVVRLGYIRAGYERGAGVGTN